MVLDPGSVDEKYRCTAKSLVSCLLAGVAMLVMGGFIRDVVKPPLTISVSKFGSLPDFVIVASSTNLQLKNVRAEVWGHYEGDYHLFTVMPAEPYPRTADKDLEQYSDIDEVYTHDAMYVIGTSKAKFDNASDDFLENWRYWEKETEVQLYMSSNSTASDAIHLISLSTNHDAHWNHLWTFGYDSVAQGWPQMEFELEKKRRGTAYPLGEDSWSWHTLSRQESLALFDPTIIGINLICWLDKPVTATLESHWILVFFRSVSSAGGYLSIGGTIFSVLFVIKHPYYVQRTLRPALGGRLESKEESRQSLLEERPPEIAGPPPDLEGNTVTSPMRVAMLSGQSEQEQGEVEDGEKREENLATVRKGKAVRRSKTAASKSKCVAEEKQSTEPSRAEDAEQPHDLQSPQVSPPEIVEPSPICVGRHKIAETE